MAPLTSENHGMLCQDVVALAPPLDSAGCMRPTLRDGHDLAQRECEHAAESEQISGSLLRLEDVLGRFHREAVWDSFDTGHYNCRYFSWGSGPPLVFVHGLGDDAQSFVMPIAQLSEHFRCICYDQARGGEDGAHLGRYHHTDFVADLLALTDHLKLKRAYLFGSSFGSTMALSAMHQQPKRFPRAVLQGGFARRPLAPAEEMLACWARYWPWTMDRLPLRQTLMMHAHHAPFAGRQPELWQFFLDRDGCIPMEAVARRALILNHLDLRPILPEIRQPILMVCGDQDPLVGKKCEQELLEGLPNAGRTEIRGCGHMAQFTHPEILAEITRRFLA